MILRADGAVCTQRYQSVLMLGTDHVFCAVGTYCLKHLSNICASESRSVFRSFSGSHNKYQFGRQISRRSSRSVTHIPNSAPQFFAQAQPLPNLSKFRHKYGDSNKIFNKVQHPFQTFDILLSAYSKQATSPLLPSSFPIPLLCIFSTFSEGRADRACQNLEQ
jgi:hypothetical protein